MLKNPLTYEIMTPQSVGVPDSRLVLGKHSGRHALSLRCEQLGYHFERRELDEVYRRFVVLSDKIKHVQDHHLLEMIREVRMASHRMPPAHVASLPIALAAAAAAGQSKGPDGFMKSFPALATDLDGTRLRVSSITERHTEQEDYLWGV